MELFKLFGKIVVDDGEANSKIDGVTGTAKTAEGKMGKSFGSIGKTVKRAFTVGAIVGFEKKVIETYATYDDQMRKVQAVTGATGEAVQKLRDKAEELGSSTRFSATEAGEGMEALGRAGWSTEQVLAGIGETLTFATANSLDLGKASSIVADGISQFGMKAEETGRFTDVLSMTARESNTDIELLGESMKQVGPIAGSLGYKVEDVSVALGMMAKKGISGSAAGTALRNTLTNMANPTDKMAAAMGELGVSMTDANGDVKPLDKQMRELRGAFAGLTPEQKAQYAASIAGKQGMAGLLAIVDGSEEDFNAMTEAIADSNGITEEMKDTMDGGLGGAIESVKSAWEGLLIKFGKMQDGFIVDGLNLLADALQALPQVLEIINDAWQWFLDLLNKNKEGIKLLWDTIVGILKVAIEVISTTLDAIGEVLKFFLEGNVEYVINIFNAVAGIVEGAMNVIKGIIEIVMGLITGDWDRAWNGIKALFSGIWEAIKGIVKAAINAVMAIIENVMKIIFNVFKAIWNAIKSLIEGIVKGIAGVIKSIWTGIKNFISTVMKGIADIIKSIWNGIKNTVSSVVNGIKDIVSSVFGSLKGVVSNIWNGIKTAILTPINAARDGVKNALDKIKGFFSGLRLKFPKIEMPKLPRFQMTGKFGLNPPSVPKLSVNWNADGAIFTKPTIFGTSQGLQGVGEAGAEAVLPIEKLGGIMADAMEKLGFSGEQDRSITQNLTINTPRHLSPAETARENRKALQRLAMEV